jgi:hypothetical protein
LRWVFNATIVVKSNYFDFFLLSLLSAGFVALASFFPQHAIFYPPLEILSVLKTNNHIF